MAPSQKSQQKLNKSNKHEQAQTLRLVELTGAPAEIARVYLRQCDYELMPAYDLLAMEITGGNIPSHLPPDKEEATRKALNEQFDQYMEENNTRVIRTNGALRLFNDLEVDPNSVVVLPLSYYLESPVLGTISREGFVNCWLRLGVGNTSSDNVLEQEKKAVQSIMDTFCTNGPVLPPFFSMSNPPPLTKMSSKGFYTTVYEFTFDFARNPTQRNLPLDVAITFWDLIVPYAEPYDPTGERADEYLQSFSEKQYHLWKRFLKETASSEYPVVTKDTWNQFLPFMDSIDPMFLEHDFDAAWPSVIDEFVEWARKHKNDKL